MEISLLEAFIAVADNHSFSAAANNLHLTQPAISKRIAQLEQRLDKRLFDRIGRLITPTEAGKLLLPRARRILQEVLDARRVIDELDGAIGGSLTLATSHHIGLHRLPPLLREFQRQFPAVTLDIRFMDSEQAHDEVLHGRVELSVATLPPEGISARLRGKPIWPDPLRFVVSRDHELATAAAIDRHILADYPAVLPGNSTYTGQILTRLFASRGQTLEIAMSTNYLETLRMLVAIGLGWSLLPATMVNEELVALDTQEPHLIRELGFVYHCERSLSNAARQFIALLEAQAV